MLAMSVDNLKRRLESLDTSIRRQDEERKQAQSNLRRMERKQLRWRKAVLDTCFALFVWNVPSGVLAMAYADHEQKKTGWGMQLSMQMLEERYIQAPIDVVAAVEGKTGGIPKTALNQAARFQRDYTLHQWVQVHNDTKGVAPTTALVKRHVSQIEPLHSKSTPAGMSLSPSRMVSTSWVQRFRKRWSLSRGSFLAGERLPTDQIRSKAPTSINTPPSPWVTTLLSSRVRGRLRKGGPPSGPPNGSAYSFRIPGVGRNTTPLFLPKMARKRNMFHRGAAQVLAVYQWWNYLVSLCPSDKTVLRLNLDETAVRLYQSPAKGLMFRPLHGEKRRKRRISQASRKQQRACITHVAIVCDNPEIQARLPHVIIGNHSVLPLYVLREIEPQLRRNVFLVRRKSAWVDASYMVTIIELLGKILKPFLPKFQPILLFDALSAHLAPKVFRAAAKENIWLIVVPGKLTWLIQPADTHVFYKYKMFLRRRYMEAAAKSEDGAVHLRSVLQSINDAVLLIFQAQEWSRAFDENGFGEQQRKVRTSILDAAGLDGPVSILPAIPTLLQFQNIWPAGAEIPLDAVFAPFLRPPHGEAPRSIRVNPDTPNSQPESWLQRLRPRRSTSDVGAQAQAAAPSSLPSAVQGAGLPPCPAPAVPAPPPAHQRRLPLRAARPIARSRPSARS